MPPCACCKSVAPPPAARTDHRGPLGPPHSRPPPGIPGTRNTLWTASRPEEIAEAEYALDNDPVELARAELGQRIPLHRAQDMTMEERRIAYAEVSERTPAQWAVASARMIAAARQRRAEKAITS